jgi:hypothetical protein
MSSPSTPTKKHDVLQLRVEWQEKFEGKKQRYLAVEIYINGEHFERSATSVWALTHSTFEAGMFHFDTCTCGVAGCAGIWNGVIVRHERGTVVWYAPDHDGGSRNAGRILRHRVYRFEYDAYRQEVTACLQKLAKTKKRKKGDVLVTLGEDPADFKRFLDELLISSTPVDAMEGSPQDRLWDAIIKGDIGAAQCALVDGADLLQYRDNAESPWDCAVTQYACSDVARSSFITELAQYLPAPIPNEANPDWLLDNVVDEGPAELLYKMMVPSGALPLNDERARRCRERLESLRAMWQSKPAGKKIDERDSWESSLDRRRELLEIELKLEALDRSIKVLEEHRVVSGTRSNTPHGLSM